MKHERGPRRCRVCGQSSVRDDHVCVGEPNLDSTMRIRPLTPPGPAVAMEPALQELPEGMSVSLEVLEGPARGSVFHIERRAVVIGREAGDFRIQDPGISRRHASLEVHDAKTIVLRDLSSTNGTYHNGSLIAFSIIQDGDEIRIGGTVLTVSVDHSA